MSRITTVALFLLVFTVQSGCGGGGAGSVGGLAVLDSPGGGGGIGGTGLTSTGTINGFGSIFVNGVEFETGQAEVLLDGENSTEDSLRLGMVVTVNGTVNEDGLTGVASKVSFNSDVEGPITAIKPGRDGDTALLTVLGLEVIVERTGTVFDGVSFDSLAIGDLVEVSGFRDDQQRLNASRIEKTSDFVAGSSRVELEGRVADLSQSEFMLEGFVVDYSGADLSEVPGSTLMEGMLVEVEGTLNGDRITADRIEQEEEPSAGFNEGDAVSVQGAVTGFVDRARFRVNGVAVDATDAILQPADLVLVDGIAVEASGVWRGGILLASTVGSRRGQIKVEARVASVSVADNTITLQLFGGTVTVRVDSRTRLDDETDRVDALRLSDIVSGDFLEVEAIREGSALLATTVDRTDPDEDVLRAPVDSFNAGSDLTLLGITYSTSGAGFENQNDQSITEAAFYSQLRVGDLVKIEDEEIADGIADEVEFESEDANSEFDDDAGDDDSGGPDDDGEDEDSGSDSDDENDEDCEHGEDCVDGDDCEEGEDCEGREDCRDGEECEDEEDCRDGEECADEEDCRDGEECEDEEDCRDGEDCEDEEDCRDGEDCEDEEDCADGEDCEDEEDCRDEEDCEDEEDRDTRG